MHIKEKHCVKAVSCAQKRTKKNLRGHTRICPKCPDILSITNTPTSISYTETTAVNLTWNIFPSFILSEMMHRYFR